MKEKGWDTGQDDEELFEYAMHPAQYEDYMSGNAKKKFLADLEKRKNAANQSAPSGAAAVPVPVGSSTSASRPKSLVVDVNGEKFQVQIDYPDSTNSTKLADNVAAPVAEAVTDNEANYVTSPLEGKFYLTKAAGEKGIKIGDKINVGDTVAYVESMKVINAITSSYTGTVAEITVNHGDDIEEDHPLIKIV